MKGTQESLRGRPPPRRIHRFHLSPQMLTLCIHIDQTVVGYSSRSSAFLGLFHVAESKHTFVRAAGIKEEDPNN